MDSIVSLIAKELKKIYPDITIYRNNQKGGFKEPSFFVHKIGTSASPNLFEIQNRTYSYQIVYFPPTENVAQDLESVESRLLDDLTVLADFATLRNRQFKTTDENNLLITFDVSFRAYRKSDEEKQEKMMFDGGTK